MPAAAASDAAARPDRPAPARRNRLSGAVGWSALEVGALATLAVSQPVLDVFGRAPEVFVEAGAGRADVWWFAIVVAVGPALLAALPVLVAGLLGGVRAAITVARVVGAALLVLLGAEVARQLGASGALVWIGAGGIAALGLALLLRTAWLHTWLRFLGVAPALFAAMFLVASPTGELALGDAGGGDSVELTPGERGPVVLLVLDELPLRTLLGPDGGIDAERFPGFARLAAGSTWFRNTTSVSSNTLYALPAILTGQNPAPRALGTQAAKHPDNLFRLLGRGYRFNVTEYVTALCSLDRCDPDDPANAPRPEFATTPTARADDDAPLPALLADAWSAYRTRVRGGTTTLNPTAGADDGLDLVVPDPTTGSGATGTGRVSNVAQPARFAEWLGRIDADTATPQLSVLHSVIPHHPWRLGADGTTYRAFGGPEVGFSRFEWLDRPGAVTTMRQRHIEMVRYADTLVTALVDRLESLGVWDDTTVVVTADHGAAFTPGAPFRSWTEETQVDIVGVPLFVHGPGFAAGAIDDRAAESVDIVPTIAAAQQIELPWAVDGVDLAAAPIDRPTHPYAVKGFPNEAVKRPYELIDLDVRDHLDTLLTTLPPAAATSGDELSAWRIGPEPGLVGRSLDDLDVGAPLDVRFDPAAGSLTTRTGVHDDEGVHALAVGTLTGRDAAAGRVVAIAIDDRIVATATTDATDSDEVALSAFVLPRLAAESGHEVRYLVVAGTGPTATLRPITVG